MGGIHGPGKVVLNELKNYDPRAGQSIPTAAVPGMQNK